MAFEAKKTKAFDAKKKKKAFDAERFDASDLAIEKARHERWQLIALIASAWLVYSIVRIGARTNRALDDIAETLERFVESFDSLVREFEDFSLGRLIWGRRPDKQCP